MIAIQNGHFVTASGAIQNGGTLLVENGTIVAFGSDISIPAGCQVIHADGKYVTPGFIEAHTHISMANYPNVNNMYLDLNEKSSPLTPALRAEDSLNPKDLAIAKSRGAGFTTACTLPGSTNVIGGTGICFKLKEAATAQELIISGSEQFKIALGENPKIYHGGNSKAPMTRMAVAAMLREMFSKAQNYAHRKREAEVKGLPFDLDFQLEPIVPVIEGARKVRAHCHRSDDIVTALKIAKEFNLDISIEHATEGYLIADYLKDQKAGFVLGPLVSDPVKLEMWNLSLQNPARMEQAGIEFSLCQDTGINTFLLPVYIGMCMAYGLSEAAAFRSVTINPARLLKLDHRIGSLDVGKDADIAIWNGHPFSNFSLCEITMIDGRIYDRSDSSTLY